MNDNRNQRLVREALGEASSICWSLALGYGMAAAVPAMLLQMYIGSHRLPALPLIIPALLLGVAGVFLARGQRWALWLAGGCGWAGALGLAGYAVYFTINTQVEREPVAFVAMVVGVLLLGLVVGRLLLRLRQLRRSIVEWTHQGPGFVPVIDAQRAQPVIPVDRAEAASPSTREPPPQA